jgi:pilus assembly protein CpaF
MARLRMPFSQSERDSRTTSIPSPPLETVEHVPARTPDLLTGIRSADDRELIEEVQQRLVNENEMGITRHSAEYYQSRIAALVNAAIDRTGRIVSERERTRLTRLAHAELLGYGPIEELLADDGVSEIMVNGAKSIWIERDGQLFETDLSFVDDDHVRRIIDRIISPLGRRCDESSPMVDARLPDGSRVNVIIPPLAMDGPALTIRKFSRIPLTASDLVSRQTATMDLVEFLRACVQCQLNVIVSGGTGTGKTTLLNVLSSFIPENERIVTIENAGELQLQQRHVVRLESRPSNIEGRGEVSMRDLVVNALRMRPDRIIIGECRAGEALDMLQAMNTGHDGSMTTLHANSPRDALRRMETMVLMSGMDLPMRAIREQIASAINLIIQLERMADGTRRITHITELSGMEQDVITMTDLFVFQNQGMREGKVVGKIVPTGLRPRFITLLQQRNIALPAQVFGTTIGRKP